MESKWTKTWNTKEVRGERTAGVWGVGGGGSTVSNHHTGKENSEQVKGGLWATRQRLLCASQQVREEIRRGQRLQNWTAHSEGLLVGLANAAMT